MLNICLLSTSNAFIHFLYHAIFTPPFEDSRTPKSKENKRIYVSFSHVVVSDLLGFSLMHSAMKSISLKLIALLSFSAEKSSWNKTS